VSKSVPVAILTGFLGSGKTTLLNQALQSPALGNALVVVNEVGEIPIDNLLIREAREDVLVLASGCVCCSIRSDLVETLVSERARLSAEGRMFERVFIETTGLADPTPIVATLVKHPDLGDWAHLDSILTAVDAELGAKTLDAHDEARKQLALADEIIVTKCDRMNAESKRAITKLVSERNPHARVTESVAGKLDWASLLTWTKQTLRQRLDGSFQTGGSHEHGTHNHHAHDHDAGHHKHHAHGDVTSFVVTSHAAIDFRVFAMWLSLTTQLHGDKILRIKGLIHERGASGPVIVHAVQHVAFPPYNMAGWPSEDTSSRIVVILQKVEPKFVESLRQSLQAALNSALPA
jgi:G3E family GTPase